ncbi:TRANSCRIPTION FACTOR TT2 [Salix viminalis]|uniref:TRANSCRIPTION FACTOR TT2 n=1 Tax=Salix viminalis TaxID=40686 RepID=A0A9Q0NQ27_SALVM|nr:TRANSCRIPTION FACTOR TT2 [Salix viminalis]
MGRKTECSKDGLNKGAWTPVEDKMLLDYLKIRGEGKWSNIVRETGRLPGRTDNEIKNYWHTTIAKKARGKPKVDRKQIEPGSPSGAASSLKNQSSIESQCTTGVVAATTTSQENSAQDHQLSVAMPQFTTGNLQYGAASNFKNQITIESQCTTEVAAAASTLQSTDSNLQYDMPKTYEFESSSKGKILDSDFTEFSGIHDIFSTDHHSNNTDKVNGDHHGVSSDGCKSRETTEFPEKLLESDNWSGNKCVLADQGFDFMSLLSFLDSTDDEWTADALGTKGL